MSGFAAAATASRTKTPGSAILTNRAAAILDFKPPARVFWRLHASLTCPTHESLFRAWLAKACGLQNDISGKSHFNKYHLFIYLILIYFFSENQQKVFWRLRASLTCPTHESLSWAWLAKACSLQNNISGSLILIQWGNQRKCLGGCTPHSPIRRSSSEPGMGSRSAHPLILEVRKNKLSGGPPGTPRERFPIFGFFDQSSL